ncbi:MAG: deoxyribonuclease IV [Clostridiales bacterium]|jgi:deoxyribonuclease-4|nr:deoxyribonuclease IV [Clostridiales bacterium]
MLKIGCHLSISKGFLAMGKLADSIGANTFQFFSRNPRGGAAFKRDPQDTQNYQDFAALKNFAPCLAHAPYTVNPCSADLRIRGFAVKAVSDDLDRYDCMYVMHPGNHVGQGTEAGISLIAEMLEKALEHAQGFILLETMAGKGTEIGSRFEELGEIIKRAGSSEKLGVCLDTCHVFDAGYDIAGDLDGVLERFDKAIGFERLHAVHLNDSKNALGSHKDRHEKLGEGFIGWDAIARIVNHPVLRELPFFLETPNDTEGYGREVEGVKARRS